LTDCTLVALTRTVSDAIKFKFLKTSNTIQLAMSVRLVNMFSFIAYRRARNFNSVQFSYEWL